MTFVGQSNSSYETKQIVLKYITFIIWEAQFAWKLSWEEFEDTKGVIRIRKSKKDKQLKNPRRKTPKGQTTIYKT